MIYNYYDIQYISVNINDLNTAVVIPTEIPKTPWTTKLIIYQWVLIFTDISMISTDDNNLAFRYSNTDTLLLSSVDILLFLRIYTKSFDRIDPDIQNKRIK